MMTLKELYLFMATVFVLSGNHKCIAETVRNTGKPSFQTLSLTSIPLNDSHTTYRGVFLAPPDTHFRFKGEMIDVTKGENNVVEAILSNNDKNVNYRYGRWLTLTSESKQETLKLYINDNYNFRTQTFVENSCEFGIEKLQKDTRTEYKATVRNCAESENISKYFIVHLLDQSGDRITQITSRKISSQENGRISENKYVNTYYRSDEDDIYYAILDYPAIEADGLIIRSFSFVLYASAKYDYTGDAIAEIKAWYYDL